MADAMCWRALGLAVGVLSAGLAGCASPAPYEPAPADIPAWLLRASPPNLVVQIHYVEGREPSPLALDAFGDVLRQVTAKRQVRVLDPEPIPRQNLWTRDADPYYAVSQKFFSVNLTNDAAALHVLYLDGCLLFENGQCYGGAALHTLPAPIVLVFLDPMDEIAYSEESPGVPIPAALRDQFERAILVHETGHVLGLVNNGAPMVRPHEDAAHPHHSSNTRSVMYWQFDAPHLAPTDLRTEGGIVPYQFDADDLADLRAYREAG